jgi:hypothetical protein
MDEISEIRRFDENQMIKCPKCRRASPPNRAKCLYCGASLPLKAENLLLRKKRKIENWEKAFNLVFIDLESNFDETKLKDLSKLADLKEEELRQVLFERKALPIARVESAEEASALKDKMETFGVKVTVISDESLLTGRVPRRLRRIEFIEDTAIFTLFNSNESIEIKSENLLILVSGVLFKRRIEFIEERKKKANKIKESFETDEDEILIDIYASQDNIGYRLTTSGFDFSMLGAEKEKLAHKNIPKLIKRFCEFAPHIILVNNYEKIRYFLNNIWHVEEQKNSLGLRRKSFGGYQLINETYASNLEQFTRYSRLQFLLNCMRNL